ncbi:SURF1 family protein [Microlunatus soli]|uniref:SURF1-like protein n=1 Tax=Microlunatus soli TaxID=630515 RepID=A0A1H1UMF1_9ACTN|nr:SURF1 family protein [Microlunatus soli]SDS72999.1 Cytochrome oxidase assembly protein ShyY1 [Microlunatus soli]
MTVLKQIAVVLLGLVLAGVMVSLGVWQLSVYNAQGREEAQRRAAEPAVTLEDVARPGQEVGDAYGRTVRFTGHYDTDFQTFIAIPDRPGYYRVLTAFRLTQGGAVPVVRGIVSGKTAPPPPSKRLTQTGVLLPPEGTDRAAAPSAEPSTVALAALAQQWELQLVNGYATLDAGEARAQSLEPAAAALPTSHGRLRNGFYALQWWVFAAFAVVMAVRMARDLGRNVTDDHLTDDRSAGDDDEVRDDDGDRTDGESESASETAGRTAGGNPDAGAMPSPT